MRSHCGAAWASSGRTGSRSRPRSWPRSIPRRWPSCSTRSAPDCATPTSCTTSCSRLVAARPHRGMAAVVRRPRRRRPCRRGRRLLGGHGAPRGGGGARQRRRRGGGVCGGPPAAGGPGDGRPAGGRRRAAVGSTDGSAAVAGPGAYGPGPPGGQGLRHRAARRSLVCPATCWSACTGRAATGAGGLVDAVPIAEYVRFLTRWQHATPDSRVEGRAGLLEVLEQLQGIEAPAAEWEAQILPARVTGYDARWLDELCLSGEIVWGRLTPRAERTGRSGAPSPATPLAFVVRDDLEDMLRAVRAGCARARAGGRRGGRRARRVARARRLFPSGAGAAHRSAPGRGGRGPVGPGGPRPRDGRRLLGGARTALGP